MNKLLDKTKQAGTADRLLSRICSSSDLPC